MLLTMALFDFFFSLVHSSCIRSGSQKHGLGVSLCQALHELTKFFLFSSVSWIP
jgi:hypothetical protein